MATLMAIVTWKLRDFGGALPPDKELQAANDFWENEN